MIKTLRCFDSCKLEPYIRFINTDNTQIHVLAQLPSAANQNGYIQTYLFVMYVKFILYRTFQGLPNFKTITYKFIAIMYRFTVNDIQNYKSLLFTNKICTEIRLTNFFPFIRNVDTFDCLEVSIKSFK